MQQKQTYGKLCHHAADQKTQLTTKAHVFTQKKNVFSHHLCLIHLQVLSLDFVSQDGIFLLTIESLKP